MSDKASRDIQPVEHALRHSEAQLRAILETTVDGIITINEEGLVQGFNPAAEKLFGYQADELLGQNVSLLMPSPESEKHNQYIKRYLETGEPHIIGIGREVSGRRKDGTVFPIDLAVSVVKLGDQCLFTGILRDATARKQVEQALTEERNFVSATLETVSALIVVLNRDGEIVRFNRTCEEITGYSAAEVEGGKVWELFLPLEECEHEREIFSRLRAGEYPITHEKHWVTRTGERRFISWSNTALLSPNGEVTHIIATGIDATDRKQAEEVIVSVSEAERQQIGRELHDALGQQLTGISLLTKALEKKLRADNHGTRDDAAEITGLARDAIHETRRLAHGLYPTELEEHGLSTALQELAERQSRVYQLRCTFSGITPEPRFDKGTALHLYRIAQEAAANAAKHGRPRKISISLTHDDHHSTLVIKDDGIGIPQPLPAGRGMGLAIMKYRADILGARFSIARAEPRGTMVTCTLPHSQSSSEERRT